MMPVPRATGKRFLWELIQLAEQDMRCKTSKCMYCVLSLFETAPPCNWGCHSLFYLAQASHKSKISLLHHPSGEITGVTRGGFSVVIDFSECPLGRTSNAVDTGLPRRSSVAEIAVLRMGPPWFSLSRTCLVVENSVSPCACFPIC